MTLKQYLLVMGMATLLCVVALLFVIFSVNPYEASIWAIILFYSSLFLSLVGLFSLIGFGTIHLITKKETIAFRTVKKSFRQGVLFASLLCVVFILAHAELLYWWVVFLLAAAFGFIEFVLAKEYKKSKL